MSNYVGLNVLHPGGFEATQRMSESCHIDKNTKVLDVACGKGTSSLFLAQRFGCQLVGIDISKDLIDYGSALIKRKGLEYHVRLIIADALSLPFSNEEFDVVISQAMLVLVGDQKRAIQEALRVTKPGGFLGWIELSWKKETTEKFLEEVATVICAHCMLNVHTFRGWENLFYDAGVKQLKTIANDMKFQGMVGMISNEGVINTGKVMFKFLINPAIRKRMRTMDKFFKDNSQYFGYGIYIGRK